MKSAFEKYNKRPARPGGRSERGSGDARGGDRGDRPDRRGDGGASGFERGDRSDRRREGAPSTFGQDDRPAGRPPPRGPRREGAGGPRREESSGPRRESTGGPRREVANSGPRRESTAGPRRETTGGPRRDGASFDRGGAQQRGRSRERTTPSERPTGPSLSHVDEQGEVAMVDVSAKPETQRRATARGTVRILPETSSLIAAGNIGKGNVLTTAKLAGIMAAKRCAELIPLAHPLLLTHIDVSIELGAESVEIEASVETNWKTGVEMEALTAVSVAALTIYDMCKAVDQDMMIDAIQVVEKSGGKRR